jgi:hypothetical protein
MVVVPITALLPHTLVVPVGFMGAPTVAYEQLPSGEEALRYAATLEHHFWQPAGAIACMEIDGMNGLEPLLVGAKLKLPIVDGDFMGRAFPELQMCTSAIYGHGLAPMCLSDCRGTVLLLQVRLGSRREYCVGQGGA